MLTRLLDRSVCAREIAAYDWTSHPLGPMETWDRSLRISLQLALGSGFPTFLFWGERMYMFFNDAYRPILGQKLACALGRPYPELWSEAWPQVAPWVERARQGEIVTLEDFEVTLERHGHPETAFFTFCYSPVRDENEEIQGIFCTVFETTDKIRALGQLHDSQTRLQMSVEASGNLGTWSVDVDTRVTTVDASFARLFQVDPAKAENGVLDLATFTSRIYEEDRPRVLEQIQAAMEDGAPYEAEYRLRQPDGQEVWVMAKGGLVADQGTGRGRFAGVAIDITRRKAMEEQLRSLNHTLEEQVEARTRALLEAEAHLRQAQKLEAIGQLTGGIAHDFNNLLQAMSGHVQLMTLKLKSRQFDDLQRHLDAASKVIDRAASLTHRLLAFARRQALRQERVDINDLVRSMIELLSRTTGPAHPLVLDLAPEAGCICVDGHQTESALLNLVINARDAMPDGGPITIRTRTFEAPPAGSALPDGPYAALDVIDAGVGMSADVLSKAAEPFFTTKPLGTGTGLGLSMVHGFASQSGGALVLESSVGQGTCARIVFPRAAEGTAAVAASVPDAPVAELPPGSGHILLVEDEDEVRDNVAAILHAHGFTVTSVSDAYAALDVLERDSVSAVLTDVGLPGGMNGRQLGQAVSDRWPGLPVIFMTGYVAREDDRADPAFQRAVVVPKPFTAEQLVAVLVAALQASTVPHLEEEPK